MRLRLTFLKYFCLSLLLMVLTAADVKAQTKIYATSYGWEHSDYGFLNLTHGLVQNRANGANSDSNPTRLSILALLNSSDYAHYQLKFQTDLPAGTSVYVRVTASINGLLGLLAGNSLVSVYHSSSPNDTNAITGTQIGSNHYELDTATIGTTFYVVITPQQIFDAIKISLTQEALKLLGILNVNLGSLGYIDVYHAYYECPTFTVTQSAPACAGHPFNLNVSSPITTGLYSWYSALTGGSLLGTGITIPRTENTAGTKNYFLQHSQFSSTCPRTNVSVNVGETPDNPTVSLE